MRLQNSYSLTRTDEEQHFWRVTDDNSYEVRECPAAGLVWPCQEIANARPGKDETRTTGIFLDFLA